MVYNRVYKRRNFLATYLNIDRNWPFCYISKCDTGDFQKFSLGTILYLYINLNISNQ